MRHLLSRLLGCLCLAALLLSYAHAPAAARSWRVGVGGGRVIGYVGTLAKHGLPRQRMTDQELADPTALARYDVVIIAYPCSDPAAAAAAVEKYVEGGGLAVTEVRVQPSAAALPGTRLGPAAGPNMTFAGCDHPISKPLANAGVLNAYSRPAAAIIPNEGANATVLAAFTDEGVPAKYRGKLTGGKTGVPALVLLKHGKGQWLYSGLAIGFSLALRGPELEPWLLATLEHFSEGAVTPRFRTFAADDWLLPSVPLHSPADPERVRNPRRDEQAAELPEGYETFDLEGDALTSFDLAGDLPAGAPAEVMLSWFNERWQRRLELSPGTVSLIEVNDGRARPVREVPRPPARQDHSQLLVCRRPGSVTVFFDGHAVLLAETDALDGKVASKGLAEALCQPTAPVYFTDDFMRAEGDPNPWETPAGAWELHKVEGAPEQGANPFAFKGNTDDKAAALVGNWFWDDYDLAASVRGAGDAVGIYAHYRAPDDYLLLRLGYPLDAGKAAVVSVIRRTPAGQRTLAEARADCQRDRWHRLGMRLSGGHLIATLDGRELGQIIDETARGWGQVGLYVERGTGLFDDVEVLPWQALPCPVTEDGPWAWRVERGQCSSAGGDGISVAPHGSARLIAPWAGAHDFIASTQLRLADAEQAGLLLRYQGPRDHYLLSLARAGRSATLRLVRSLRGEEQVLAERPVGGRAEDWRRLSALLRGERIAVHLDGAQLFEVSDAALSYGKVGLHCTGDRPAHFRSIQAMPDPNHDGVADPPTPPYAGIIDLHTWAGRGSSWVPSPEDLDLFWHRGLFTGPLRARLGVHRDGAGRAAASLALGDGAQLASGYCLSADQPQPGKPIAVTMLRLGKQVASTSAGFLRPDGFTMELDRIGDLLLGRVNGRIIATYRDPEPLPAALRAGFRRDAAALDPSDTDLISPAVRTYTFTRTPVDWRVLTGTWDISNRWSCSPQWTWLAGWHDSEEARIRSKRRYLGDQQVDVYLGAKMMPAGNKRFYEELRDVRAGLCEDDQGASYRIIVGGKDNTYSCLERNGTVVAENNSYRIPTSGLHNNWLLMTLARHGNVVSVSVWDHEVLRYEDPDPLPGGYISLGTHHNGIIVPRISIYAQPDQLPPLRPAASEQAARTRPNDILYWQLP